MPRPGARQPEPGHSSAECWEESRLASEPQRTPAWVLGGGHVLVLPFSTLGQCYTVRAESTKISEIRNVPYLEWEPGRSQMDLATSSSLLYCDEEVLHSDNITVLPMYGLTPSRPRLEISQHGEKRTTRLPYRTQRSMLCLGLSFNPSFNLSVISASHRVPVPLNLIPLVWTLEFSHQSPTCLVDRSCPNTLQKSALTESSEAGERRSGIDRGQAESKMVVTCEPECFYNYCEVIESLRRTVKPNIIGWRDFIVEKEFHTHVPIGKSFNTQNEMSKPPELQNQMHVDRSKTDGSSSHCLTSISQQQVIRFCLLGYTELTLTVMMKHLGASVNLQV
ncbi:hypothetical protein RRG08_019650 [Elysia crispata]|uniref:Uncharacterized protein n=1 Tax=Elysia crispata TaxID=231223 RepID=A0AAE1E8Y6_9GAST|nr:hypothetical protein RRG08_019650 [Elysia crispata]